MDKELEADLSQMTMYSKMGRYISNKILKYNKKSSNTYRSKPTQPPPVQYITKTKKSKDSHHSQAKSSTHRTTKFDGPPVGYYKLKYDVVQKNARTYNFNRSVPHFFRDKYLCHQSQPALKDYPDLSTCKPYVKGLVELKRNTGRSDIKGSVRKFIEDPHENRFQFLKNPNQNTRSNVNFDKILPRDNRMFKNYQFAPEYDYDYSVNMKRLDTHIVPFQRVEARNGQSLMSKTGISDCWNQDQTSQLVKTMSWKKMLPREKTGLMPSYMDKNINNRTSIGLLNLKTLEMNCSQLKQMPGKIKKKGKKQKIFMEDNKENMGTTSLY